MTLLSGESPNIYINTRQSLKRTTFFFLHDPVLICDITAKMGHTAAQRLLFLKLIYSQANQ